MESRAGASRQQQGEEKRVEQLMDEHLRANGLSRKKIAKDGSCLFRAVAEQVLHSQGLHTRIRAECVQYLRQKRDQYESFIEGDFEEYLQMLRDPQSWVGQVEISALSVLYKHDFIIYQNPGEPPVNITENGYPDKVLLCFLNDNHYDSVYPISSVGNAAMCQSILYELLYERVYGVERNLLTPSLRGSKANNENSETAKRESSGDSDLDEGEGFWSSESTGRAAGVNNRATYKGRGRGQARGAGRGCLLREVQDSLNPAFFRNVEYDEWVRSKRVQQRKDFCMAAGMHYKAGDKCQARLNNSERFYSAYIQDVSPDDGPVTVFIEELGQKYNVPLWNLRSRTEDPWSTVTEKSKGSKSSSSNGPTERDTRPGRKPTRSVSHGPSASSGSAPGTRIQQQHSWPPQSSVEPPGKNASSRRSEQGACTSPVEDNENALLELLNKDEENFPTLEASAQAASVEGSRRAEKKGSRKKVSTDTKEQPINPVPKAEKGNLVKKGSVDQDQRTSPSPKEEPNPAKPSITTPNPSAPKSTKPAVPSSTAAARIPYKASSSLSARILSSQPQTALSPSTRSTDSLQTTAKQSPSAPVSSTRSTDSTKSQIVPTSPTRPQDSTQTTPMQSSSTITPSSPQTAPAPSAGPRDSFQTRSVQSSSDPASSPRSIVLLENITDNTEAALQRPEVNPGSSQSPLVQPETLTMPSTSVTSSVSSQCTNTNPLLPTAAPSNHVPTPLSHLSSPQTAPELSPGLSQSTSGTPHDLVLAPSQSTSASDVPCSTDVPAALKSTQTPGVCPPAHVSHPSLNPPAQPTPSPAPPYHVAIATPLPYPPYPPYPSAAPSLSPNLPALVPDPCLPPAVPTPPFPHATESYLYEPVAGAGGSLVPDPQPESSITLEQLCQERLYPGFPQNEKGECVQLPPFSELKNGKDLPNDTSVLRFFFNLGLKAYLYKMLPPVTYLAPLFQAHQHMQLTISPSPVSWQPENNSRAIFPSPNPSPALSGHYEVRGVVRTPSPMDVGVFGHPSLPMQMPVVSHPGVYAGVCSMPPAGPLLQFPPPQHLPVPPPGHYGMEIQMAQIMDGGQRGQSAMTPPFWASQTQQRSEGAVPVTAEMQVAGGGQGKGAEPTSLSNGNRQEVSVGFVVPPLEGWKPERGDDLKSGRSYQSYRSGGRQGDRGGYRGRGTRERRDHTSWGRHDGQIPYHRGSGGRSRGRGFTNT